MIENSKSATFVIFIVLVVGCGQTEPTVRSVNERGYGFTPLQIDFTSIVQAKNLRTEVSGLMDHDSLSIEWVREEIQKDSISSWVDGYSRGSLDLSDPMQAKWAAGIRRHVLTMWNQVAGQVKPTDRIFYYSTPDLWWYSLGGQDGLIVVRECSIVAKLIIMQS